MKIDITGALLTLSLSIVILNSQCEEGASDVNVYWRTLITFQFILEFRFEKQP